MVKDRNLEKDNIIKNAYFNMFHKMENLEFLIGRLLVYQVFSEDFQALANDVNCAFRNASK